MPAPSSSIPQRTVLGSRAKFERIASQEFHLVLVNTDGAGAAYPLGSSLKIGKAPDNDIVIDHPTVSRNHLVVRRQGDQFLVQDLGSTNGTFLNGNRLNAVRLVEKGDRLQIGDTVLEAQ